MKMVGDTSAFLAVALNEPERPLIIKLAAGYELVAPEVLPFEIGNALSSLHRRGILRGEEVLAAWDAVSEIAVVLSPIDIRSALGIAAKCGVCAYDACFLECALRLRAPILTLDKGMKRIARELSIPVLE